MPSGSGTPDVYVDDEPPAPPIVAVPTAVTAFVGRSRIGPLTRPSRCVDWSGYERRFGGLEARSELSYSVRAFFDNGGATAIVSRAHAVSARRGTTDASTYLDALERLDLADDPIDLVVLAPPTADRDVPLDVWEAAERWCRERGAVLLVDPPATWRGITDAARRTGMTTIRSDHTAWYYPRLLTSDAPRGGEVRPMAPSGAVAGVIARTDARRGVWRAPAGLDAALNGAVRPEAALTQYELGTLTRAGINAIRTMPRAGTVVWGARTGHDGQAGSSEWNYLPVRRVALHLDRSIGRGLDWVVFEPNGVALWTAIRGSVDSFLFGMFRAGAFAGQTPRECYVVRCDASTTTTTDVRDGVAVLDVGVAPLRPAEFVALRWRLTTADA